MVYQHTTALWAVDVKDSAAVTLMGTDVERIVTSIKNVQELWASIPGVGIAIWLLARQVSYAAIVPLVICLSKLKNSLICFLFNIQTSTLLYFTRAFIS